MPEDKQPEIIRRRGESYVTFYSNNLQVEATPWDFKLFFGEIEKTETTGGEVKLHVEDKARIVMSPQHAKAMLKVLQDNLGQYEARIGPIPDLVKS